MSLYQKVCFTLNNYSEDDYTAIHEKLEWDYLIMGKEIGACGTPHIQGYGELISKKRLSTLKRFNEKVHWEKLKAKAVQAAEYCKKEGDFQEWGSLKVPEVKKDLKTWITYIKKNNMRTLMEDPPNISTIKVIEKYLTYCEPTRCEKPHVTWFWGSSGSGKSRKAAELAGPDVYWKDDSKWWDGYDGHQNIIIDDFRGSNMKFTYLLRLLDRYPMRVEVKGGYRQMRSLKIFITSIVHPESVYSFQDSDEPIRQLIRRLDEIVNQNERVNFVTREEMESENTI